MESFKDEKGGVWNISLSIGTAKKLKAVLNLDIVAGDPSVVANRLATEVITRMDAMWLMVDAEGRTQEDFDNALEGEAFKRANVAFWAEFGNFIQRVDPVRHESILRLVEKMTELSNQEAELIMELATSRESVEAMAKVMDKVRTNAYHELGKMSTEFPAA